MKTLFQRVLASFGRAVLKKYKPIVVGVTGSVGKTSTSQAVYTVLAGKFSVRQGARGYNNEFGVPLTIIGSDAPGRSALRWIGVFGTALGLLLLRVRNYPKLLVLEYGADHPGDIQQLLACAPCDVAVVTAIGHTHTEFFGSIDNVQKEKTALVTSLTANGVAVLNADDERVLSMRGKTQGGILTFGFGEHANVHGHEPVLIFSDDNKHHLLGMQLTIAYEGTIVPVLLPGVISRHQAYAALAAAAVGLHFGMNLIAISKALATYQSLPGRMKLVAGIKETAIIDDSYNSSPMAAIAALDALSELPSSGKKIAVLGDMAELGAFSEKGHAAVGKHVALIHPDMLITVGAEAKHIKLSAEENGMPSEQTFAFDFAVDAGKFLQEKIGPHDVVLIKGSQRMRMERAVEELMAEPDRAKVLLVRQGAQWLHKV